MRKTIAELIPAKRTLASKGDMTLFLDGKSVYLFSGLDNTGRFVCTVDDFRRSKRNIEKDGWTLA
jgi:hypothetical protein